MPTKKDCEKKQRADKKEEIEAIKKGIAQVKAEKKVWMEKVKEIPDVQVRKGYRNTVRNSLNQVISMFEAKAKEVRSRKIDC